ncbi:MAG: aminoglycoside phosphotransferase, partial [Coriobacteriales bacterium]
TPYILDWAHATQGNAAADAARTYLIFRLCGADERAETYMSLYCEKTGTARSYVERILPIVAATQTAKSTEEEKAFLRKWVEVADWQ